MNATPALWTADRIERCVARWPALCLFFFGLAIVYVVGFSDLPRAHNATHDARHAAGMPCH
jgi:cobalt transporter subunit CbtB